MTREEILTMKQGKELDCLVTEHIFKIKPFADDGEIMGRVYRNSQGGEFYSKDYSSEIRSAWEVFSEITAGYKRWNINYGYPIITITIGADEYDIPTESIEEAICKAALLTTLNIK
jgi:hypothetical protein